MIEIIRPDTDLRSSSFVRRHQRFWT